MRSFPYRLFIPPGMGCISLRGRRACFVRFYAHRVNEIHNSFLLPATPFDSMLVPASSAITEHITLDRLRYLLTYPVWGIAQQFAVRTRSYEEWFRFVRVLLRAAFIYQHQFTEREQRSFFPSLFHSLLHMLDKLDRWEEYLSYWHALREHTSFYSTYALDAILRHDGRIDPFVLSHHGSICHVHFLHSGSHRKLLIERKLDKKQSGCPLGNMLHAPKSELSPNEIRSRIVWLIEFLRYRQRSTVDWKDFWSRQ